MEITYIIDNLDRQTADGLVTTAHWRVSAVDGDYSASCYGSVGLPSPSPASFTPYEDVTEAQVQAWTEEALGAEQVESYKTSLANQIAAQKNPTSGNLPPPWAQS